VAVEGHAWQVSQRVETQGQLLLFFHHLGELLAQHVTGVGVDLATIAVDDQLDAVNLGVWQVNQAHNRRDTHGPSQDRNVGVTRAKHRDQANQCAFRNLAEHRRRQFFADQNGFFRVDQVLLALLL